MSLFTWFDRNFGNGDYLPNGQAIPVDGRFLGVPEEEFATVHYLPPGNYSLRGGKFAGLAPTRDEWAAWRDDPTTRFVMAALRAAGSMQRMAWDAVAWEGGNADQLALREFTTRADAYASIEQGAYEDFCAWAGVEPDPMPAEDEAADA